MINIIKYDRGDMAKHQTEGTLEEGVSKVIRLMNSPYIRIDMDASKATVFPAGETGSVIDLSKPYYVIEAIKEGLS